MFKGEGRGQEGPNFLLSDAPILISFFVALASLCYFYCKVIIIGTPPFTSAFSSPPPCTTIPLCRFPTGFISSFRLTTFQFQFLSLRNDIMVLLSREDIFSSRENLSLDEEELDVNRLDYYQVSSNNMNK